MTSRLRVTTSWAQRKTISHPTVQALWTDNKKNNDMKWNILLMHEFTTCCDRRPGKRERTWKLEDWERRGGTVNYYTSCRLAVKRWIEMSRKNNCHPSLIHYCLIFMHEIRLYILSNEAHISRARSHAAFRAHLTLSLQLKMTSILNRSKLPSRRLLVQCV